MKHTTLVCLCLSGLWYALPPTATAVPLPPDLAKAVADYDAAQIHGDGAALQRLLAEDYTLVNSSGETESKAQLIADYTAPGYKLDPFTVREPIEKVWADGAVMGSGHYGQGPTLVHREQPVAPSARLARLADDVQRAGIGSIQPRTRAQRT